MTKTLLSLALAVSIAAPVAAQSTASPADDRWNHIIAVNTLTADDKKPFYLKVEFQIFDLKGKPVETGIAEEWWSEHRAHITVNSPSWNEPSRPDAAQPPGSRERYLIHALLNEILHPAEFMRVITGLKKIEADRAFGPSTLHCVSADPADSPRVETGMCVEPASDVLRISFDGGAYTLRTKVGKFQGVDVSTELSTTYGVNKAITGKIVELKTIAADDSHLAPAGEAGTEVDQALHSISGVVLAGRKLKGDAPMYPIMAREQRTSGTVVLAAIISKEGKITALTVIASPDPGLTYAATSAVRTWTYQPYLLNGKPTDVDTTIVVNFNLRSSP